MTDKTDIAELREHNQHIVAHLTRSNPRRPLSSVEVLTLESARIVVASLSVRDGLPDVDHSEYWFEHEGKLLFDGALFNSRVAIFIDSKLEAERQRADALVLHVNTQANMREAAEKERDELQINWNAAKNSIQFYKAEIAELREKLAKPVVLDPHTIARAVRKELDRKSCPDAYMPIAYEACISAIKEAGYPVSEE